jgi:hypothetical protein
MDPQIEELLGLEAVRARAHAVLKLAEQGRLNHFNYHAERMEDATDYVLKLIQVGAGYTRILKYNSHNKLTLFNSATLAPTNTTSFRPMDVGSILKSAGFPA